MAALTLTDIINFFQAVLEGAPFSLKATREPFSHDRQPNSLLDNSYRLEDGGLGGTRSTTNDAAARLDNLSVWIAKKLAFSGQAAIESLEDSLVAIERRLKADGRQRGYHVEITGRKISRTGDIGIASISFSVDYDFSEAVA